MALKTLSFQELVAKSAAYFASNPEVDALVATAHNGKFYRTEFEEYAQEAARKAGSETVVIYREAHLLPLSLSVQDAMAEAGLVMPPLKNTLAELVAGATHFTFLDGAVSEVKPSLAELVAGGTRFTFPAQFFTESAPVKPAPAKRGRKPAAPATESAPVKVPAKRGRKPGATTKTAAAKEKKTTTKTN